MDKLYEKYWTEEKKTKVGIILLNTLTINL